MEKYVINDASIHHQMNVLQIIELFDNIANRCSARDFMNLLHVNITLYAYKNKVICKSDLSLRYSRRFQVLCADRLECNQYTCFVNFESENFNLPSFARHAKVRGEFLNTKKCLNHLQSLHFIPPYCNYIESVFEAHAFISLRVLKIDRTYRKDDSYYDVTLHVPASVEKCIIGVEINLILSPNVRFLKLLGGEIKNYLQVFDKVEKYHGFQTYYHKYGYMKFDVMFPNMKKCTIGNMCKMFALPNSTQTLTLKNYNSTNSNTFDLSTFIHLKTLNVHKNMYAVKKFPPYLETLRIVTGELCRSYHFPSTIRRMILHVDIWSRAHTCSKVKTLNILFSRSLCKRQESFIPVLQLCDDKYKFTIQCAFELKRFDCRLIIDHDKSQVTFILKSCFNVEHLLTHLPETCDMLIIKELAISNPTQFRHDQQVFSFNANKKVDTMKIYDIPSHLKYVSIENRRIV